jgi:hypothetical protein
MCVCVYVYVYVYVYVFVYMCVCVGSQRTVTIKLLGWNKDFSGEAAFCKVLVQVRNCE